MATPDRPKVVVIGAGAAGVFTAVQLQKLAPNQFEITILDRNDAVGGNARGCDTEWQGQPVHIDCGAQFFFETTEPVYCDMLRDEGFFDEAGLISETSVGMSVWNASTKHVEFAVPNSFEGILEGVARHPGDWVHFVEFTWAAIEKFFSGDWTETFGDWLARIWLSGPAEAQENFKKKIARPLMYQFGLMPPQDLDALSALGVVYFFVGSLPWPERKPPPKGVKPKISPFHLYTCNIGMDGIQKRLLEKYGLKAGTHTSTSVASIAPQGDRWAVTTESGPQLVADEVVFATNPLRTRGLLPNTPAFAALRDLLSGMPYQTVPVHVQRSPSSPYVSPEAQDWEVANVTLVEDENGDASHYLMTVWFGPLKGEPGREFWKSWGSPNLVPENQPPPFVLQTHEEVVYIPDYVVRRDRLRTEFQGASSLWYTGGYILDYDTQDSCLKSGRLVAEQLIGKYGFPAPPGGGAAVAGPPVSKENPPPLLVEIERVLRALHVSHEVLDAFKARPRLAGG